MTNEERRQRLATMANQAGMKTILDYTRPSPEVPVNVLAPRDRGALDSIRERFYYIAQNIESIAGAVNDVDAILKSDEAFDEASEDVDREVRPAIAGLLGSLEKIAERITEIEENE